jgi:hypothetical protein
MAFVMDPPWGTEWIDATMGERGAALADLLGLADALPQGLRKEGSPRLAEKVVAVDQALTEAGTPHAMGGAIAIAYYGEPRVTIDIDVNVFASADRWPQIKTALASLGIDVKTYEGELTRHGETRLRWDRNQIHLFFATDALHDAMPGSVRQVPLLDSTISIVSPEHLTVRKATLDRAIDWLDIEAILIATQPLDVDEIRGWLVRLAGHDDPRLAKLDQIVLRPRS